MKTKHTEGPWILDGTLIRTNPENPAKVRGIASVHFSEIGVGREESEANGVIMALAPKLDAQLRRSQLLLSILRSEAKGDSLRQIETVMAENKELLAELEE